MIKARAIVVLVTVVLVGTVSQQAFARGRMYHPGLGVFMQRDPIGTSPAPVPIDSVQPIARNVSSPEFTRRDPVIVDSSILPQQHTQDIMQMARASAAAKMRKQIGFIPVMQNPSLLQYANGMNLYAYTCSNPINSTDPSGLDRYIVDNGALGGVDDFTFGGHTYIVLDEWEFNPKKCCWVRLPTKQRYDFSANYYFGPLALACAIYGPGLIRVSETILPTSNNVKTFISMPWEDIKMTNELAAEIENPPNYSVLYFNCWHWSSANINRGYGAPPPVDPSKRKVCRDFQK